MEVLEIIDTTVGRYLTKYEDVENPSCKNKTAPTIIIDRFQNGTEFEEPECVEQPPIFKEKLPFLIGPDRETVRHTTNTLISFDGEWNTRPNYLKNIDIVGTQSRNGDISSSLEGFNQLVNLAKNDVKKVWCTMCSQEWERTAPFKESLDYLWAPPDRLLRTSAESSHRL
jgi:hypothetical protein